MINVEQIATHIIRYMNEDGLSKHEAQAKALKTLNIQEELTESQQKAVDEKIKQHEESVQEDQENADLQAEEIEEEAQPETDPESDEG